MSALYLSVLDTRSRTLKLVSAMASLGGVQEAVNAAELKRIIEGLPLETSAGTESLHLMSWLHLAEPTLTC